MYIKIISEERRQQEATILRSYSRSRADAQAREYAECIAARTREAIREMERKAK